MCGSVLGDFAQSVLHHHRAIADPDHAIRDSSPYTGSGKARTGAALSNPVLQTEGLVTLIDGILATAVLASLVLNAALGWWWADPAAGYVLVFYAAREVRQVFA